MTEMVRTFFAIDLMAFYASVDCYERNRDSFPDM